MSEPWGSPIDRAAEALALHRCRMSNGAMENVAWRSVHPDVREEYIAEVRLVLRSVSDNPKDQT